MDLEDYYELKNVYQDVKWNEIYNNVEFWKTSECVGVSFYAIWQVVKPLKCQALSTFTNIFVKI